MLNNLIIYLSRNSFSSTFVMWLLNHEILVGETDLIVSVAKRALKSVAFVQLLLMVLEASVRVNSEKDSLRADQREEYDHRGNYLQVVFYERWVRRFHLLTQFAIKKYIFRCLEIESILICEIKFQSFFKNQRRIFVNGLFLKLPFNNQILKCFYSEKKVLYGYASPRTTKS